MPALKIIDLAAFAGASVALLVALYHFFWAVIDLRRREASAWLPLAGPFAFFLPNAHTDFGRAHRNKSLAWMAAFVALGVLFVSIGMLSR